MTWLHTITSRYRFIDSHNITTPHSRFTATLGTFTSRIHSTYYKHINTSFKHFHTVITESRDTCISRFRLEPHICQYFVHSIHKLAPHIDLIHSLHNNTSQQHFKTRFTSTLWHMSLTRVSEVLMWRLYVSREFMQLLCEMRVSSDRVKGVSEMSVWIDGVWLVCEVFVLNQYVMSMCQVIVLSHCAKFVYVSRVKALVFCCGNESLWHIRESLRDFVVSSVMKKNVLRRNRCLLRDKYTCVALDTILSHRAARKLWIGRRERSWITFHCMLLFSRARACSCASVRGRSIIYVLILHQYLWLRICIVAVVSCTTRAAVSQYQGYCERSEW